MTNGDKTIVLLKKRHEKRLELLNVLTSESYKVVSATATEQVMELISKEPVGLVLASNVLGDYNGFKAFKMLKPSLASNGIPFFLCLDSADYEDVIMGLEMGIDNFIFFPLEPASLLNKIKIQFQKKQGMNVFESLSFKSYSKESSLPMVFFWNGLIQWYNPAFSFYLQNGDTDFFGKQLEQVFHFTDHRDELNFRRLKNGVFNECKLKNLRCCNDETRMFDMNLFRGNHPESAFIFGEAVPRGFLYERKDAGNSGAQQDELGQSEDSVYPVIDTQSRVRLTPRERQVLDFSAQGLPVKIIANKLKLSERTIEKHRSNIMGKANASNIIEAIRNIQ